MELNVGESSAVLFFVNQQQQQLCSPGWVQRNGQGKYKSTRQNTEKNALSCQNSWFVSTVDVARKGRCMCSVQRICTTLSDDLSAHANVWDSICGGASSKLSGEWKKEYVCEGVPICYSSTKPLNLQPSNIFGSRPQKVEVIFRSNYKLFPAVLLLECFHVNLCWALHKVYEWY